MSDYIKTLSDVLEGCLTQCLNLSISDYLTKYRFGRLRGGAFCGGVGCSAAETLSTDSVVTLTSSVSAFG
ncbi:hypothetical protein VB10N_44280 [Vibrio sp. 10N]|nr:hypothetical protein VB10N_44280 [Vibrio sp. 10N]